MVASRAVARGLLGLAALLVFAPVSAETRAEMQARHLRALKHLQHQMLLEGGARKLEARRSLGGRRWRRALGRVVSRPPRDRAEALGPQGRGTAPRTGARGALATPSNARINDVANDPSDNVQSEVSIAAIGERLVAAWNEGGLEGNQPQGLGFGYSSDGGRTWRDGGMPPRSGGVALWVSDPVVVADPPRARFYLVGLVIADGPKSGVAVVRGAFSGDSLVWEAPRVPRATRDTFPDKPWIAVDSLNGNVYLGYTTFYRVNDRTVDEIEFQRSLDGSATWSPPAIVSLLDERGLVQGCRPAVGPSGEVHLVWKGVDTTRAAGGRDAVRIRTSYDGGASFGERHTVAEVFTNFCTGPPGFNRGSGLGFPSIAVDRSSGPDRGRLFVAWEEALDFYDDPPGTLGDVLEQEPNGTAALASHLAIGQRILGRADGLADLDWHRFEGSQGQTVMLHLELEARGRPDVALRLYCGDADTRLAYSAPLTVRSRVVVHTLARTGEFYVAVVPLSDSTGAYVLSTGLAERGSERGRDHRDVFVSRSDDGASWSAPVRVSDSDPWFDDWLPELTVGGDGKPYLSWYDWREGDLAGCGAASNVRLARSDDGAATWTGLGAASLASSRWSDVSANLTPNLGDYHGLFGDERALALAWGDGRNGNPDVFVSIWPMPALAREVSAIGSQIDPGGLVLTWRVGALLPVAATVYRSAPGSPWAPLGRVESDAGGTVRFTDTGVQPGWRYDYRLGVQSTEGEVEAGETSVTIPESGPTRLSIERVQPNPSPGTFQVWFRRAPGIVRLELLDVRGRRVLSREIGDEFGTRGALTVDVGNGIAPGLYLLRLSQEGRSVRAKVVVVE